MRKGLINVLWVKESKMIEDRYETSLATAMLTNVSQLAYAVQNTWRKYWRNQLTLTATTTSVSNNKEFSNRVGTIVDR